MKNTKDYYNQNAMEFFAETVKADMSKQYQPFLERLPQGASILDAGCGSGRDSLAFKQLGYKVTAIDGSKELCKLATKYIGQEVKHICFQEIDFQEEFDGIWACATLLHVPSKELPEVLKRLYKALKSQGILYTSFKYGDFEGNCNGRYFHHLKEEKAKIIFTRAGFNVIKMWITNDVREGRRDGMWMNILLLKLK